jgi:hypothetical protein
MESRNKPIIRLTSDWFCAGVILDDECVVRRWAPILWYMRGWNRERVLHFARRRRWAVDELA